MFTHVLALSLAASSVFADCGLYPRDVNNATVICNARGTVIRSPKFLQRQFYAPNIDFCNDKCQSEVFDCFSYSYNEANGECRLLNAKVHQMGFSKDASSPYIINSGLCYEHDTGCSLQNPSFELFMPRGNGIRVVPTGYTYPQQQIYLTPWTQYNNATAPKSFTRIVRTGGASNGKNFAQMSISGNEKHYIGQSVVLHPSRQFHYSFDLKYAKFQGEAGRTTNTVYTIEARFNGAVVGTWTLDPSAGDADNLWKTYSGTLNNPHKPYDRYFDVAIQAADLPDGSPVTSVFGLDNFSLELATAETVEA